MSEELEERKIAAWFKQVYPESVELAMATKNLNEVMEETALLIANLKDQLAACQKEKSDLEDTLKMVEQGNRNLSEGLAEAKEWVADLQSGMYINCVYCGHRYGPEDKVPASMADVLKAHVEICPKHPMSKLKSELAEKDKEIERLKVCEIELMNHRKAIVAIQGYCVKDINP